MRGVEGSDDEDEVEGKVGMKSGTALAPGRWAVALSQTRVNMLAGAHWDRVDCSLAHSLP